MFAGGGQKFPYQITTHDIRPPIQLIPWTKAPPSDIRSPVVVYGLLNVVFGVICSQIK